MGSQWKVDLNGKQKMGIQRIVELENENYGDKTNSRFAKHEKEMKIIGVQRIIDKKEDVCIWKRWV